MTQIRKRLTYANVMSSIAVFLVLGGATAFAATKIGSNEIKSNAITTGKIKKEAVSRAKIKKAAIDASKLADGAVTTSKLANDAVTGEKANESTFGIVPTANHANTATTAAPRAYARVLNANGGVGVDESRSKGITDASVTEIGGSVYCFELGFTPSGVQATVDWISGGASTFAHATVQPYVSCPAGNDASVRTTDKEGAGINTINFYVSFID